MIDDMEVTIQPVQTVLLNFGFQKMIRFHISSSLYLSKIVSFSDFLDLNR